MPSNLVKNLQKYFVVLWIFYLGGLSCMKLCKECAFFKFIRNNFHNKKFPEGKFISLFLLCCWNHILLQDVTNIDSCDRATVHPSVLWKSPSWSTSRSDLILLASNSELSCASSTKIWFVLSLRRDYGRYRIRAVG